jgi:hypothetical protein
VTVDRIEVTNLTGNAELILWKATLYDSLQRRSTPLENLAGADRGFDTERWQLVYNQERVRIFHNTRALPRVWIAKEAEVVDAEEALRRIRGESARDFDPRRTALLEIPQDTKIEMPAGKASTNEGEATVHDIEATAHTLLYEPNRIVIETSAERRSVLSRARLIIRAGRRRLTKKRARLHRRFFVTRCHAARRFTSN